MGWRLLCDGPLTVVDYCCTAGPRDRPYAEVHSSHSLSYVRRGSFGCRTLGGEHRLLAGGFLVGSPGVEFICTHDHREGGDECLSIQLAPDLACELTGRHDPWRVGAIAPLAELAVFGECAQAAAVGQPEIDVVECGLVLVARFLALATDAARPRWVDARLARTVCRTAEWIDAHSSRQIGLFDAAREAGMSPFHFLRSFRAVLGLTPHQHLLRCRLRKAARRLLSEDTAIIDIGFDVGFGDVSNFVRTFGRAAGVPPNRFRHMAQVRKNLQELPPAARSIAGL